MRRKFHKSFPQVAYPAEEGKPVVGYAYRVYRASIACSDRRGSLSGAISIGVTACLPG